MLMRQTTEPFGLILDKENNLRIHTTEFLLRRDKRCDQRGSANLYVRTFVFRHHPDIKS
jgi:hypothetical protein